MQGDGYRSRSSVAGYSSAKDSSSKVYQYIYVAMGGIALSGIFALVIRNT